MSDLPDGLEFEHCTAERARGLREVVEDIYRRSYVDVIATGELFDTPEEFMTRFDAYTRAGNGFELVLARVGGRPIGQAWGWPLRPKARWWEGLHLDEAEGDVDAFTAEDGARTFAFSEIMVCADYAGRGVGRALHDELLRQRTEPRSTLLVEPDNPGAYERYERWGWRRVGHLRPDWPDAPLFHVLVRP